MHVIKLDFLTQKGEKTHNWNQKCNERKRTLGAGVALGRGGVVEKNLH